MDIPTTLPQVTTPLALAALILLLGAGTLRLLLKSKPNPVAKSIVRWGFIVSLVFGVLAIASFFLIESQSLGSELRFAGTVRDSSGSGLEGVSVTVTGCASGVTGLGGNFELTIPGSRKAKTYEVVISHPGWQKVVKTIEGPRPGPLSVSLERSQLAVDSVISVTAPIVLTHYLGQPQLTIPLTLRNSAPRAAEATLLAAVVESPAGQRRELTFTGYGSENAVQWVAETGPFLVKPGAAWSRNVGFANFELGGDALVQRAQEELGGAKAGEAKVLPAELVQQLTTLMERRLIWTPGEWKLHLACSLDGARYERVMGFTLSAEDVARMRAVAKYYPSGAGVLRSNMFPVFSDANPTLQVTVRP
jgi:hypothetical protein